jgi:hypothetical protein
MNKRASMLYGLTALLAALLIGLPAAPVTAQPARQQTTITLQNGLAGYTGCSDTYIDFWAKDTNAEGQNLSVQYTPASHDTRSSLLRFDLLSLPAGGEVISAVLSINTTYHDSAGDPQLVIGAYGLRRPWLASQATWNQAAAGQPWAAAGANDPATDRDPTAAAIVVTSGANGWIDLDITALVARWYADAAANYGVILRGESTAGGGSALYSFIHADAPAGLAALRPKLTIVMQGGSPPAATVTPTPTPLPPSGSLVLQNGVNGYAGCLDTYIDRYSPTQNFNPALSIKIEYSSGSETSSGLLRFDLAGLPAGIQITSATLSLYSTSQTYDLAMTVRAYALRRAWNVDEVTWNNASAGQPWGAPGANDITADRAGAAAAAAITAGGNAWINFDITALAATWYADPSSNLGVLLRPEAAGGPANHALYSFVRSEATGASVIPLRPKLTIVYTTGAPATSTATATATPGSPTATPTATQTATIGPAMGTLVLQNGLNGYTGCRDTELAQVSPNTNFGNAETMQMRNEFGQSVRHFIIKFDLSPLDSLPAGATITSARLGVYATNRSNALWIDTNSYRLLRPWGELQATWNVAKTGEAWGAGGALQFGVDRAPAATSFTRLEAINAWLEHDWTSFIPTWRADPTLNQGAVITVTAFGAVSYWFASSENPTPQIRPRLVIQYVDLSTPTPTATPPIRARLPLLRKGA